MNPMWLLLCAVLLALPASSVAGSVSIAPAVIPLNGSFGQGTTQALALSNGTNQPLDFVLEAQDVSVRDGKRVLSPAGRASDSIAATAVFSPRAVTVPPNEQRTVQVTLTVPLKTEQRAVVVYFRGTTVLQTKGAKTTASLGALLTFTLSQRVSLTSRELAVKPQTARSNPGFSQELFNDGTEPVVVTGAAVVVDANGRMLGRADFEGLRLLPGERGIAHTDFPAELERGRYRAVTTLAFDRKSLTKAAEFRVP
jgi:hypothetical protein